MSSKGKPEPNDFLEEAASAERRAAFTRLPDARFVAGTATERLNLLFELKELAFALAGDQLDLRALTIRGGFIL